MFRKYRSLILLLAPVLVFLSCTDSVDDLMEIPAFEPQFLGEVDWVKSFGGSGEDTAQAIIPTSDGGYAILGFSNSTDGDLSGKTVPVNDYWLIKLDTDGGLQWSKTYGGSKDDRGQSLEQTADNGFIITGYAMSDDGDSSNNEGFHDNWIIKLDASGNIQWEKSFGFSGHDHSYDILQTSDGGYFFTGFLDITAAREDGFSDKGNSLTRHGVGEFWGTKLDAEGTVEWRRYFGGTNNDRAHAVVEAADGGFVMTGFSESSDFDISNSRGSYDFWVLKVNAEGTLLWESSFGGSGIDISYDIVRTPDNAYCIVGNTFSTDVDVSNNNGESDVWLIKVDDDGKLLWEKSFGGSGFDVARSIELSADGGFIISGNSKSSDGDANFNHGENDLWLLKTNALGGLAWQKSFGGSGLDFGFDSLENPDKSILLVGEIGSADMSSVSNKGMTDVVVLKIR